MQETTYDFRKLILFLRGAIWLLILGVLLGAGVGYIASKVASPVFQATTKIMITRAGQPQSADFTTYLSDLQMTQTYVQLLNTETVLNTAADRLGIKLESENVDAHAVEDTQVIVLRIENNDPRQAASIANTIIEVLMEQNEIIQAGHYKAVEESLYAQKTQIESAIQDLQNQIEQTAIQGMDDQKLWLEKQLATLQVEKTNLEEEILQIGTARTPEKRLLLNQKNFRLEQVQSLTSLYQNNYSELLLEYESPGGKQIDPNNSQLALLTTAQDLYQEYYASVLDELEAIHLARLQNVPNIVQIEVASVPEKPIRPISWLNMVLGMAIGVVFMTGVAFLRSAMDDTLRTKESIESLLEVPVIGFIGRVQRKKNNSGRIHITQEPYSPIAEDFRLLRANLELAFTKKDIHTILISSPQESEGRTTMAINLAACLSQTNKRVALLEADLRRPQLQTLLGIPHTGGVNSFITEQANIQDVSSTLADIPNLLIVPAGRSYSDPTGLLGAERMRQLLKELKQLVDVVVIDSPPSFLADAQILASQADAVLLVVRPGITHAASAQSSIMMFERTGVCIAGVVMNCISHDMNHDRGRNKYLASLSD